MIDFRRVRISFPFGFSRNQTNTAVLCVLVSILNPGADFGQIWLRGTLLEIFCFCSFYTSLLAKPLKH